MVKFLTNRVICAVFAALLVSTVMGAEYVWTGAAGDGKWITPGNWDVTVDDGSGEVSWETATTYPGSSGVKDENGKYTATVKFTNSVECIDLEGKSIYLADKGDNSGEQALRMQSGISVKLKNGFIYVAFKDVSADKDIYTLGASGSTNIFEGVKFRGRTSSGDTTGVVFNLQPNEKSTVIYDGDNTIDWTHYPKKAHTMIVRNGTTTISKQPADCATGTVLWITNAILKYTINNSYAIAKKIYFRDGEDRLAQIVHPNLMAANVVGQMNIIIPENGRITPFIECAMHGTADSLKKSKIDFVLDVTNWKKGGEENKIPLLHFTQQCDNAAVMETKINYISLTVLAQGENPKITTRRNARLEWVPSDLTLYYLQDKPSDGFKVIVR